MNEVSTLVVNAQTAVPSTPKPTEEAVEKCRFCQREIRERREKYYSRQAGMRGWYHWGCFVQACHQANQRGAKEIELVLKQSQEHSLPEDDLMTAFSLN